MQPEEPEEYIPVLYVKTIVTEQSRGKGRAISYYQKELSRFVMSNTL